MAIPWRRPPSASSGTSVGRRRMTLDPDGARPPRAGGRPMTSHPSPIPAPAPEWLDRSLYPFASRFFDTADGRLHYIDEGSGAPIVFVHGTPTWSFLYRRLVARLATRHRVIAVDHLGFGLSDKPAVAPYKPRDPTPPRPPLPNPLHLSTPTPVVLDFGAPIVLAPAPPPP